jgi:hypothetical protein
MNKKGKWILGIFGSLVIGALGSGLWNGVFSPVLTTIGRGLMSLLTLVYSSERDDVYDRAAVGLHELPSNLMLMMVGGIMLTAPVFTYLIFSKQKSSENLATKTKEELKEKIKQNKRQIFWLLTTSFCLSAFLFMLLLFLAYSNTVISRFNQELAIVSPYITEQQHQIFQSRFASMKTRAEFVKLFDELNKIAEENSKPRSEFTPW